MTRDLTDLMAPDWAAALTPVADDITAAGRFLREELAAGRSYLPAGDRILRAFAEPMADVRVLIIGQDPYPTPGHPVGLSFSVAPDVRPLPRSLVNIYAELEADLGIAPCPHGDLTAWAQQGVLLLNRVLTVRAGAPASHRGQGWEAVTEQAIRALVARRPAGVPELGAPPAGLPVGSGRQTAQPLVAILWGRDARSLKPMLGDTATIESAHPSPLSASGGFFGSRPFSRANAMLEQQGSPPVDWRLPDHAADTP